SRLAGELEDHFADLEAEAARLGVPADEAIEDAKLRLGKCAVIAREFERRPELQSWVYRSRWLERLLRAIVAVYLLVRAPARVVGASQAAMLRYTAATAAGASVTCCILLLLTALVPSDSSWGVRFVEHAGFAFAASQHDRASRGTRTRQVVTLSEAGTVPRDVAPHPEGMDAVREPELPPPSALDTARDATSRSRPAREEAVDVSGARAR